MKSSFARWVSVKKYYLQTFSRMGCSVRDYWSLATLAWGQGGAPKESRVSVTKHWSARLKDLKGMEVHLCPDDVCHVGIFEEVLVYGAYDLNLVPFEPDLVLDVGAHIGLFSLLVASRWPNSTILAFEPHPENAVWARRNLSSNGIRATLIEAAASLQAGWMNFSLGGGMGRLTESGESRVMAVDLAAILKAFPCSNMLLKMDIEGGEMDILPDILKILPGNNAVFVELHGEDAACDEMQAVVKSLGFTVRILADKRPSPGTHRYVDLLLLPASV